MVYQFLGDNFLKICFKLKSELFQKALTRTASEVKNMKFCLKFFNFRERFQVLQKNIPSIILSNFPTEFIFHCISHNAEFVCAKKSLVNSLKHLNFWTRLLIKCLWKISLVTETSLINLFDQGCFDKTTN
jgi:hypothetical protein